MTVSFPHWIPVALFAMAAVGVSCTPAVATVASPTPSASLVLAITATPEPTIAIQSPVAPFQSPVAPFQSPVSPFQSPVSPASPTGTVELVAPVSSTGRPQPKINLDAIAPPGHARDLILQNCGTCHSFICAFRGQRTVEHWQTIKEDMRDKVSQLDDQEYANVFAYLEANFNDQKPEPELPPELQQLGCSSGVR